MSILRWFRTILQKMAESNPSPQLVHLHKPPRPVLFVESLEDRSCPAGTLFGIESVNIPSNNGVDSADLYLVSIEPLTGTVQRVKPSPFIGGQSIGTTVSALDPINHRFFLIVNVPFQEQLQRRLLTVDTQSGSIINSAIISHPLAVMEYDTKSEMLYGEIGIQTNGSFTPLVVQVNPGTGGITPLSQVPDVNGGQFSGVGQGDSALDQENQRFFFSGRVYFESEDVSKQHLYSFDVPSGTFLGAPQLTHAAGRNVFDAAAGNLVGLGLFPESGIAQALLARINPATGTVTPVSDSPNAQDSFPGGPQSPYALDEQSQQHFSVGIRFDPVLSQLIHHLFVFDTQTGTLLADPVLGAKINLMEFEPNLAPPVSNEDLLVNTPEDELDDITADDFDFGDLALREALAIANTTPGRQTIRFDPTIFPDNQINTIALNGLFGQLSIADDVDILGMGRMTIDGQNRSRLFSVLPAVHAELDGLILKNGHAGVKSGGAILAYGGSTLAVNDSVFTNNQAAIAGAIFVAGKAELSIKDSTFQYNNAVAMGGAIVAGQGSTITITGSTLHRNRASRGGGLFAVLSNSIQITNSTISRNMASAHGGAIYAAASHITISHTTITDNRGKWSGGIHLTPNVIAYLRHSVVAGNLNIVTNSFHDVFGSLQQRFTAYNVIGSPGFAGGIQNGRHGNIVGAYVLDVLNIQLANNGGPTLTHALVPDSLALNAGDPLFAETLPTDQRGLPRILGGRIDIGAVEQA